VQDLVGRNLGGRYRLLGLLGSGGMGAVFEAEQSGLRRRVAVKVLRSLLADRASPRARWVLSTRRRPVRMRVIMTTIIGQAGRPFNVDEADGVNGRHRVWIRGTIWVTMRWFHRHGKWAVDNTALNRRGRA
jgi:serine/threonine protein kinase